VFSHDSERRHLSLDFSYSARHPVPSDLVRNTARTPGTTIEVPRYPGSTEEAPRRCGTPMEEPELRGVLDALECRDNALRARFKLVGYAWKHFCECLESRMYKRSPVTP
jgi:hypothetical protein